MLLMKILGANKSETETVPESEMEQYLQEPQKVQVHPFKWWKDQSTKFPVLERLARKYLVIPATSVPCECLFSTAFLQTPFSYLISPFKSIDCCNHTNSMALSRVGSVVECILNNREFEGDCSFFFFQRYIL